MCCPSIRAPTSSAAIVFSCRHLHRRDRAAGIPQHFPASGWVEHEPEDIWTSTVATCREALKKAGLSAKDIAAIASPTSAKTTVVWDRVTGKAVHRAIVCRTARTADICARLKAEGHEPAISAKTGLIIDPYFSGTKVAWILDQVPGARARAERGETDVQAPSILICLWRLTGGRCMRPTPQRLAHAAVQHPHRGSGRRSAEDPARAALHAAGVKIPRPISAAACPNWFDGAIAIRGIAGDQQAATIGQACFSPA